MRRILKQKKFDYIQHKYLLLLFYLFFFLQELEDIKSFIYKTLS